MTRHRTWALAVVVVAAALGGCVGPFDAGGQSTAPTATDDPTHTATPVHSSYAQTTVTVQDGDGDAELGAVEAAIADNGSLRYTGLSNTESLPENRGMLFVFDSERDLTFVMREMDFAIDIVYIDSNGTITSIHHAPAPGPNEDGNDQEYSGRGQYVLEVNHHWTTDRGIEVGDQVAFELPE
jgi:uncharacterized membrane protein (UPF0127 family)